MAGLITAIVVLQIALSSPAHARYQFGSEDNIKKIVDLSMRGDFGEQLYLGYRMKVYSFFAPVFMVDEGYVIGFSDDSTRYMPLNAEQIATLQKRGQLPSPLPAYRVSWGDWIYGYFLWVIFGGMSLIVGIYHLLKRNRSVTASSNEPLTVAAMAARRNRFILTWLMLPLAVLFGFLWLVQGIWLSVLLGPREATNAEIVAMHEAGNNHAWFTLNEAPHRLGVDRILTTLNQHKHVQKEEYFLYLVPGTPNLIIEARHAGLSAPFYAWPSGGTISEDNFARAKRAATKLGYTSIAPFMLTVSDHSINHTRSGTAIVVTLFAIPLLLVLYGIYRALRGLADPLQTHNVRLLLRSARAKEGLEKLVAEINAQAADAKLTLTDSGRPFLLPSWLITNVVSFSLMSVEDVLWVVAYEFTENSSGVKKALFQEVNVVDRFGRHLVFRTDDVGALLRQIMARAPWAVLGPDAAMQNAFGTFRQRTPNGVKGWLARRTRPELIRRADERREVIMNQMNAHQAKLDFQ